MTSISTQSTQTPQHFANRYPYQLTVAAVPAITNDMYPIPSPFMTKNLLPESLNYVPLEINRTTNLPSYLPSALFDYGYNKIKYVGPIYTDINNDPNLRKITTEKYYKKAVSNWTKYQFIDLYKYVTIKDGKAVLIKNIDNLDKYNDDTLNIKHDFIIEHYLTKNDFYILLEKFVNKYRINWWNIEDFLSELRDFIYEKMKKYMKKDIKS